MTGLAITGMASSKERNNNLARIFGEEDQDKEANNSDSDWEV